MEKVIVERIRLDRIKNFIDTLFFHLRYVTRRRVSVIELDKKVELRVNGDPLIEIHIHKDEKYGGYLLDIYLMGDIPKKTRTLLTNTIHVIVHRIIHGQ